MHDAQKKYITIAALWWGDFWVHRELCFTNVIDAIFESYGELCCVLCEPSWSSTLSFWYGPNGCRHKLAAGSPWGAGAKARDLPAAKPSSTNLLWRLCLLLLDIYFLIWFNYYYYILSIFFWVEHYKLLSWFSLSRIILGDELHRCFDSLSPESFEFSINFKEWYLLKLLLLTSNTWNYSPFFSKLYLVERCFLFTQMKQMKLRAHIGFSIHLLDYLLHGCSCGESELNFRLKWNDYHWIFVSIYIV